MMIVEKSESLGQEKDIKIVLIMHAMATVGIQSGGLQMVIGTGFVYRAKVHNSGSKCRPTHYGCHFCQ